MSDIDTADTSQSVTKAPTSAADRMAHARAARGRNKPLPDGFVTPEAQLSSELKELAKYMTPAERQEAANITGTCLCDDPSKGHAMDCPQTPKRIMSSSALTIRSAVLMTGLVMGHTLTYVTTEGADIPNGEAMASITPHTLGIILVRGSVKSLVPWSRVVSCELA